MRFSFELRMQTASARSSLLRRPDLLRVRLYIHEATFPQVIRLISPIGHSVAVARRPVAESRHRFKEMQEQVADHVRANYDLRELMSKAG